MTTAHDLERRALAEIVAESQLSLEELASLPAFLGTTPSPDCVYDGSLIELCHRPPLLATGGELSISILGPSWDRIFRLEFFGVISVGLSGFGPALSMDIRELVLEQQPKFNRCMLLALNFPISISVTYASVQVSRLTLQSPLERS